MTAQRVQWLRDVDSVIMATVIPEGMAVYNITTKLWHVGDGATLGGTAMVSIASLTALPTTLPATSGQLWWDGGVLSKS